MQRARDLCIGWPRATPRRTSHSRSVNCERLSVPAPDTGVQRVTVRFDRFIGAPATSSRPSPSTFAFTVNVWLVTSKQTQGDRRILQLGYFRERAAETGGCECSAVLLTFSRAAAIFGVQSMNTAHVRSLVGAAYTAGLDSSAWDACLRQFARVLRSATTGLHHYNADGSGGGITSFVDLDPEWLRDYEAYYAARNAFMLHGAHLLHSGVTLTDYQLCRRDVLVRTEWYNDYLLPHRIEKNIGVCLFREPSVLSNLTIMRHEAPFTAAEVRFVRAVVPHFQQAIRVRQRLQDVTLGDVWSADLLDRVPAGLYLLGGDGRVLHMNEAARAQLATDDGLSCNLGMLRGATAGQSRALARAVSSALATVGSESQDLPEPPATVRLTRPSLRPPWSAVAVPLKGAPHDLRAPVRVLVIVSDPARRAALNQHALRVLFGLTRTEVDILESLLCGETVSVAADRQRITTDTARTHVKHILRKTGATRQHQLVSRLAPASVQTLLGSRRR